MKIKYTGEVCQYCGAKIWMYGPHDEYDSHISCSDCFLDCCEKCVQTHECLGDGIPEED